MSRQGFGDDGYGREAFFFSIGGECRGFLPVVQAYQPFGGVGGNPKPALEVFAEAVDVVVFEVFQQRKAAAGNREQIDFPFVGGTENGIAGEVYRLYNVRVIRLAGVFGEQLAVLLPAGGIVGQQSPAFGGKPKVAPAVFASCSHNPGKTAGTDQPETVVVSGVVVDASVVCAYPEVALAVFAEAVHGKMAKLPRLPGGGAGGSDFPGGFVGQEQSVECAE